MDTIKSYKCPCCGAPIKFDASVQSLRCESCKNEFSPDTLEQMSSAYESTKESKFNWDEYIPREYGAEESGNIAVYSCPSCAAEITGDDSLGATVCPYCGNTTIIKGKFEGSFKPDYVIPFKLERKKAIAKFMENASKKKFIPKEFKDESKLEEIVGMYVPFWTFDCDADADIIYSGRKTKTWLDANYTYTRTDFYKLFRSGKVGFANVPVDGSKKADDNYMEAIEPFDYSEAMNFSSAYLSGYLADKYDVSAVECIDRANERIKHSMEEMLRDTTYGYEMVTTDNSSVKFDNGKIRYALLPVWWLNIKYKDKMYKFAMNGQTGKSVGNYPAAWSKIIGYFSCWYGILTAVALIIWNIFMN